MDKLMSGFDGFLGNVKLKTRLIREIRGGRLSHAYIIEGAPGSGKKTLAKLICAAISCHESNPPCMECPNCGKIMRGQSPDVIFVEPDKDRVQLGVDVVRRLRSDAVFAANDLDNKFYIFPDARTMNPQAQNSLLKILEEPPDGVMFLLLCTDAGSLLPTIRSRAPVLRIEPLTDDLVKHGLLESCPDARELFKRDEKAFRIAVRLSGGSLGRAMELCSESTDYMRLWNAADGFIALLAKKNGAANELEFYEYASKIASSKLTSSKQRAELRDIYLLLANAVRDLIASKLAGDFTPLFYISPEKARETAAVFPMTKLLKLPDIIGEALAGLDSNANVALIQCRTALAAASGGASGRL